MTRQGDTHTITKTTTTPDTTTITLTDPLGNVIIESATPTYDDEEKQYTYTYTFPINAILGNWKFTWTITTDDKITTTDEIVNLEPIITATYAEPAQVIVLTHEAQTGIHDTNHYEALLIRGLSYSDRLINNHLGKADIPIPNIPHPDLIEAGNLYAAALIINTYYQSNDNLSPTATEYNTTADQLLESYTQYILKTNTTTSNYQSSHLHGETIPEILNTTRRRYD